jgi:aspartyl-tRNA(Asn)/glutamyl-tRNA(Gln) amidotransferase subunit A
MTELIELSAVEQAALIREKKISSVELLEATLAQVEKVDGRSGSLEPYVEQPEDLEKVHAVLVIGRDHAMAKA